MTQVQTVLSISPAPTGPPSRPHIVSFSSSIVALSWLPPALEETNGVIRSYTISVHENETNSDFEISARFTHKIVESLHPFYTYSFKVRAETVGPGPYSAETSRIQLEEAGKGRVLITLPKSIQWQTKFMHEGYVHSHDCLSNRIFPYLPL